MRALLSVTVTTSLLLMTSCSRTQQPLEPQVASQPAAEQTRSGASAGAEEQPTAKSPSHPDGPAPPHHAAQEPNHDASTAQQTATFAQSSQPPVEANRNADSDNADAKLPDSTEQTALAVFKRRITPILKAENPSSCSECHLSGVDLKQYIGTDQETTFASLRTAGLINMSDPDASKILTFIKRSPDKSSLVTAKVRQEEYTAFRAWIHAAVKDPQLAAAQTSDPALGPTLSVEVIRHARKDRVMASFLDNVWSEVGRCAACHSPDRNDKQVKEHGEQVSWITLNDPQATLEYMLDAGLIDPDAPLESLLLTKPTMQVEHGGGKKVVVGDRTYKQFRRFIDDYSSVVHAKYASTDSLPDPSPEVSHVTDIWFKLTKVPAKYDQQLLQVDLHHWADDAWTEHRVASSDRLVFGKGELWQHSLSLMAPRGSTVANEISSGRLPPGRYLVKIYIDQSGKLEKDFRAELGEDDFVGQIELESRWPAGYGNMTVVEFPE